MKLNRLSATQALGSLKSGQFSSQELTRACLDQIHKTDKDIHAFLTLNPNALKDAQTADQKIKESKNIFSKFPLLGIPYALKDSFLTTEIRTTAASKVLDNYIPQYDATVYARLKQAGAVLLGKTNMDAWAHGSSTETSDYGPTKNPWNLNHLPGGSSGGSAAAVASDQCVFAIGSETAGSIRQPAAWCGVTGFKPSYGRVSRNGLIAFASSTDSPGPITKNVADAALVTQVIGGYDQFDATTSPLPVNISLDKIFDQKSLAGTNIGFPREYLLTEMKSSVKSLIKKAAQQLELLGAKVTTISLLDPHYSLGVYTIVCRSETSSNLARYDGIRFGNPRSYFAKEAKKRIVLGAYTLSSGYYDQYYNKAQKVRTMIIEEFRQTFKKFDLIIGPVSPGPALKIGASALDPMFGEMQDILVEASALSGLTSISLPCGFVAGLPIGLQITGPQFAEQKVLEVAHVFQKATNWHLQKPALNYYG